MFLEEFFDPKNIDHINAYVYRQEYGYWPKDFLTEDIEISNVSMMLLLHKFSDAYINLFDELETNSFLFRKSMKGD
jgi:hypothetical protein